MGSWCIRLCRGVLVRQILTSWDRFGFRAIQSTCKSMLFVVLVCFVFVGYLSMLQFQCLVWSAKIEKLDPKEAQIKTVAVWFVCVFRVFLYITASFLKLETFLYCRDFLVVTILTVKKPKMFHPIRSDCKHSTVCAIFPQRKIFKTGLICLFSRLQMFEHVSHLSSSQGITISKM